MPSSAAARASDRSSSSATACRPNTASFAAAAGSRCSSSASPREHIDATVVNASISGDTTAGGLARLPTLLRERKPGLVVIELGGNDALRGLPLEATRANLLGDGAPGEGGGRARC